MSLVDETVKQRHCVRARLVADEVRDPHVMAPKVEKPIGECRPRGSAESSHHAQFSKKSSNESATQPATRLKDAVVKIADGKTPIVAVRNLKRERNFV